MSLITTAASFIHKFPKTPANFLIGCACLYAGFNITNKITDVAAKNLPGLLRAKSPLSCTGGLALASIARANPAFALLCSIVCAATAASLKNRHYTPEQFKRCLADPNYKFSPNPIVDGCLDLNNWTNLTSLPKGLRVKGSLSLDGCTGLASLPKGLRVGGYLSLEGCTGLVSVPEGLYVSGSLFLNGCTGLTFLPKGVYVGSCLYLRGCTNLIFLSQGLYVEGDLDLSGCTSFTSLPEDLDVGHNLNLSGCARLASLPKGLRMGGSLYLDGCIGLVSLPEGLYVYCDLYLTDCTNLTSLPEKLIVGGDLSLKGCINLTALPSWITQLGWRLGALIRSVDLTNTGLSENIINKLRTTPAPGMEFDFPDAASASHKVFSSLKEAFEFWKKETKNTDLPLPEVAFGFHELNDVLRFLGKLTDTAEYKNIKSRSILANRVMEAFRLMAENEAIKSRSSDVIHQGLASWDDRIISTLDEIELIVTTDNLESLKMDEAELQNIGKSYLLLNMVNKTAEEYTKTLSWVDEIEVCLALQTGLADRFNLPLPTQTMSFGGCAQIKTDEIHKIGDAIEKEYTPEALEEFLFTWSPWIKFQQRNPYLTLA